MEEWSNYACFGYVIAAAESIGMQEKDIVNLIRAMYTEMDSKTIEEAKEYYLKSDY